jgi:mono/diheme cytochrome c family protein
MTHTSRDSRQAKTFRCSDKPSASRIALVICTVCLSSCAATTGTAAQPTSSAKLHASNAGQTIWAGVYALDQAQNGEALYRRQCSSCHGNDLEGNEHFCTPPLVGEKFWERWAGKSVGTIYDTIRQTMPDNEPGSLSGQEYAAIVSFVLKANEVPAGTKELSSDVSTLNRIMITNHGAKR